MSPFPADRPRSKLPLVLLALLVVLTAAGAAVAYFLGPRLESEPPQIQLGSGAEALGAAPLEIRIRDDRTGLKSFAVTLEQGGAEIALASERLAQPVPERAVKVDIAKAPGVKEGPAVLRVVARDASLRQSFEGNAAELRKEVVIDVTPPTLGLVAEDRYVNFGGVGAIVYQASPDTVRSGLEIGGHFFPGFAEPLKGQPGHHVALFAHPYDAPAEARPTLVATDRAGNTRKMGIGYELKNVRYKKSTIAISDAFVRNKVAPLLADVAARQGSPKEVFVAVNKVLRKANDEKIAEITSKATPQVLWSGAFAQLSNSKVEANFADHRTYTYNGEPIDDAYHLGYDLSVTRHYPVEAANSGNVAFAGDLGIYGNTVIVDHGLGLYTLYSHLSSIDVKPGEAVAKRQILGKTGETGLAAGDHLHFGIYLHGVPVLPVEWWDAKWIGDNVAPKLAGAAAPAVAEARPATPGNGVRNAAVRRKK